MRLSKIVLLISLLFLAVGCEKAKHQTEVDTDTPVVQLTADWFKTDMANHARFSVDYIPLETTEHSLIGEITDFKIDEDKVFVLDKTVGKSLLIFDENGKFLNKISRTGKGPDEINSFNTFTLNRELKEIVVSDLSLRKILIFDYHGKLKKTISNSQWFMRIEWLKENSYLYYLSHYNISEKSSPFTKRGPIIIIGSLEGKIKKTFFEIEDKPAMSTIVESFSFSRNNNDMLFTKVMDRVVYGLEDGEKIGSLFKTDFGKYNIEQDYRKLPVKNYRHYVAEKRFSQISEISSTTQYYALTFENPVQMPGYKVLIQTIIPKSASEIPFYYIPTNLPNNNGKMLPGIEEAFGDNFYGFFSADQVIQANENVDNVIFRNYTSEDILQLKETDNPVLVKMKIHE